MFQFFRSFQWLSVVPILGLAVLLRLAVLLSHDGPISAITDRPIGAWGTPFMQWWTGEVWWMWGFGVVSVTFIGFTTAVTLQHYRLSLAGVLPALVAVLLASASIGWLGFSSHLLAALAIAVAAHQLFNAYRHQGAALPVFNGGLWIGVAWMLSSAFLWFALWGILALLQLRKVRFSELIAYLFGILVLPYLYLTYHYVWGDFWVASEALWRGIFVLPTEVAIRESLPNLSILLIASLLTTIGYTSLTNRRPVQEQRANRMWYLMLGIGWLAMLISGNFDGYSFAFLLPALSPLLGIWLWSRPAKLADSIILVALLLIVAGYAYTASAS